jgi:ABC-2 type transport system ATP-binding protein
VSAVPWVAVVFEARQLTKRYHASLVVDDVSFQIARGEVLGYLGPNGSGKSTTIKMILGLVEPTSGSMALDGRPISEDPIAFKQRVGYVPEEPHLYAHLTAREYLRLVGRLRQIPAEVLEANIETFTSLLSLDAARDQVMFGYSKGMRQRVLLAAGLMHDPELLILDEPFSGLDVHGATLLLTLIRALAANGKMILFSSHRLDVVERVCRRVCILHRGRIVASGAPEGLRANGTTMLEEVFAELTEVEDHAERVRGILAAMKAICGPARLPS